MPRDYNLIQRGELQERLSRGLEIKERSPAPVLESTVTPTVLLEDLTRQTPFIQPVERRWGRSRAFAAVAAELTIFAIENPAGSGIIVVIDSIVASNGTGIEVQVGRGSATGIALIANPLYIDRRSGIQSPVKLYEGSNAASNLVEGPTFQRRVSFSEEMLQKPLIIIPGEVWNVEALTVNIGLTVSVTGVDYGR